MATIAARLLAIRESTNYKWWGFFAVAIGTFMAVVDNGSVNIALPTIAKHFDTDIPTVQWVTLGSSLTISATLLPAGRLADVIGRKQVYIAGFILFGLGSALAGAAPSLTVMILFKMLSGCGAAMVMANGMAILTSLFPPKERGKAIGTHMTVVGSGSISGPVLGGLLVSALGWRAVFYINFPLAILGVAVALAVLDPRLSHDEIEGRQGFRFDWLGAALSAGALSLSLLALTNGHRFGWGSPLIAGALLLSVALLATFIWWEGRAPFPMLDLKLFKIPTFSLGALSGFLAFMGGSSIWFLMPFYLQKVLGYSPGQAGLVLVANAVCMATVAPLCGRLSDRFGFRMFNLGGLALSAGGLLLLSRVTENSTLALIIPALLLQGSGMGMFHSTNHASILGSVERARYGIAAAFVNLNRNTASTTGLAVGTAIVTATMASQGYAPSLDAVTGSGAAGVAHAFTLGFRTVLIASAALMIVAMAAVSFKGKRAPQPSH